MKRSSLIKIIFPIWGISVVWLWYYTFNPSHSSHWSQSNTTSSHSDWKEVMAMWDNMSWDMQQILAINPVLIWSWDSAEKTHLWEILSSKNWQIYSYREWIIDKILVDVWSKVKAWQVVARLLPSQYSADLANMIVEKKSMKIKAEGMVKSAQLTLDAAIKRKQDLLVALNANVEGAQKNVDTLGTIKWSLDQSTSKQLQQTIVEQDSKIAKAEESIKYIDTQITTQKVVIENMKKKVSAMINLEQQKASLMETMLKPSIRYAYNTLVQVFYWWAFTNTTLATEFNWKTFSERNSSKANQFASSFTTLYSKVQNLDNLSTQEVIELSKTTLKTVELWIEVLENTITKEMYSETMLASDKNMLIMAKTDDMNWLITNVNKYNEQVAMQEKEKSVGGTEVSNEEAMLEKMYAERKVMEKDLIAMKAEKERMIAETENMKTMQLSEITRMQSESDKMLVQDKADLQMAIVEADKMITEAQKMLIDWQTEVTAANESLRILESAWFSNEIKAPFDWTITKRNINVWEAIMANSPIFDIVSNDKKSWNVFVRFEVPESEIHDLKIDDEVEFIRTQEPLVKYKAHIQRIASAVNPTSKWVLVEATVEENKNLLVGSAVRVIIKSSSNKVSIPLTAIKQWDDWDLYVYKVVDWKVIPQIVKTERIIWDKVYVTDWLNVTDLIITDASANYEQWQQVDVTTNQIKEQPKTNELEELGDWHSHWH